MNFLQKHIRQHSEHTRLTPEEKSAMRSVLLRTMAYTPTPVVSPYLSFITAPQFVRVTAGALVVVLLVGTTTYAAQGALPGDFLYPVKTQINEKVQSALATSDEAKAQLNVDLAVERVQEAEQLAVTNRLSSTTVAELETSFDTHTTQAAVYTKKMSKKDALRASELSAQFSTSLDARAAALGKLDDSGGDIGTTTASTTSAKTDEKNSKKFSDHVRARAQLIKEEIENTGDHSGSLNQDSQGRDEGAQGLLNVKVGE